jgi:hypothetical protein
MESPTNYKLPKENDSLCIYVLKKNFEKKKIELEQQRVFEEQKRMIEDDQIFYNEFKKNIERRRQLYEEQKKRKNIDELLKKVYKDDEECKIM